VVLEEEICSAFNSWIQAWMRGVHPSYKRDERERRESEVTLSCLLISAPLSRRRAAALN
jgi:hypothetical protein